MSDVVDNAIALTRPPLRYGGASGQEDTFILLLIKQYVRLARRRNWIGFVE